MHACLPCCSVRCGDAHACAHAPSGADADISQLPQRRTDGARVVDLTKHQVKLYTTDGGMKLIKRWVEAGGRARREGLSRGGWHQGP